MLAYPYGKQRVTDTETQSTWAHLRERDVRAVRPYAAYEYAIVYISIINAI